MFTCLLGLEGLKGASCLTTLYLVVVKGLFYFNIE